MSRKARISIPMEYLVGDMIGSLLAGFGLAEALAGTNFVPVAWRFPNYGWVMFAVGVAIMIPCFFFIINAAMSARKGHVRKGGIAGVEPPPQNTL